MTKQLKPHYYERVPNKLPYLFQTRSKVEFGGIRACIKYFLTILLLLIILLKKYYIECLSFVARVVFYLAKFNLIKLTSI